MKPYYFDKLPTNIDKEFLMVFLSVFMILLCVVLLFFLIFWIIRSMSLHTLARRRGIRHAWMAWIPIGSSWVLGSVADQYQHLVQGKIASRRKLLLVLATLSLVLGSVNGAYTLVEEYAMQTGEFVLAVNLVAVLLSATVLGINITKLVFRHICSYDLYRSCNPKNAVAFLVLGIIFPVCEPFFYLACRRKDLGMIGPEAAPVHGSPEF